MECLLKYDSVEISFGGTPVIHDVSFSLAPGKILGIKANVGDAVKKGQVIMVLEAMKMENEIVAPQDGTVASVNVAVNAAVEAGDVLATLN